MADMASVSRKISCTPITLASEVALDTSTTAELAVRLEAKGWLVRQLLPRRQRSLSLTDEGQALLARLEPALQAMHSAMLNGLTEAERSQFLHLLHKFVSLNNEQSRAPLRAGPSA